MFFILLNIKLDYSTVKLNKYIIKKVIEFIIIYLL